MGLGEEGGKPGSICLGRTTPHAQTNLLHHDSLLRACVGTRRGRLWGHRAPRKQPHISKSLDVHSHVVRSVLAHMLADMLRIMLLSCLSHRLCRSDTG